MLLIQFTGAYNMKNITYQTGSTLLEGLIAITIFSFGMLGTISFQANMISQSTQTSYRLNASMQVNSLIGAADADQVNYACYTFPTVNTAPNCTNATDYITTWVAKVKELPGATATPPTAIYDPVSGTLTVTVFWKMPNEDVAKPVHSFKSISRPVGA